VTNISITQKTQAITDGTITQVEFSTETFMLGTDTTTPYSYAWTNAPLGRLLSDAKANG